MLDLLRTSDAGMIKLNGKSSWDANSRHLLSYLPEKFQVNKSVSGEQYCRFVFGVHQQKMNKQSLHDLCAQLDFNVDDLKKNVNHYSKGMMQKLGLMSNFMLNKPLMILDEPLSGLDPKARFCLKQLLQKKKEEGLTLFYSTHMLADAEEICDQFAILDGGSLKFVGTPQACKALYKSDTLESAYMQCLSA
ncbi:MAG: ATP-binding cassette domain-containing protein, partial [Gammaproteobacteria bacterium]|nr:ATP-binding cassette domain-containing protein [Gammaproteobacteria bacterium]